MSSKNGDFAAVIHQACGVLMVRNGTSIEQAYDALFAQADSTGQDAIDVAIEIVRSLRHAPSGGDR